MVAAFFVQGGAPARGLDGLSAVERRGPTHRSRRGHGTEPLDPQHRHLLRGLADGAINFIATTVDLRCKGMTLMRMPLTCWTWLVTAILGLLGFAVLLSAGVLLLLDRTVGTSFFLPRRHVHQRSHYRQPQRRVALRVAAPVLVFLRTPRGVHRDSARHGRHLPTALHLLAQAGLRL